MADLQILDLVLADEARTLALGAAVAGLARSGDVIALAGDLGSGKTVFARGFIRALAGAGEEVPSPTFTLVQCYDCDPVTIWHFDLYRLNAAEEALELGIEEAFFDAVSLIEWPERLGAYLPDRRLLVRFGAEANGERRALIEGGADWAERLKGLSF